MSSGTAARLIAGISLLTCVCGVFAAGKSTPRSTSELLTDLARDHALSCRSEQTAADVQMVETLLKAALEVEPKAAQASMWLHELAVLSGDDQLAGESLQRLLEADPTNETAFLLWLTRGVAARQTAEDRQAWLEQVVATSRPASMKAQVHVELARTALEQLDRPAARAHVDAALALDPACAEAASLAVIVLDEDAAPPVRLAVVLRALERNPLVFDHAWQAGALLHAVGEVEPAERFFAYAVEIHEQAGQGVPPPAGFLLDMAHNALARDDREAAIRLARQAAVGDPTTAAEAGMFLHYVYSSGGSSTKAEEVRKQLSARFAQVREPSDWPVNEVAQASWFYASIEPQPQRALMLARSAAERAPNAPFVQRVLGWALYRNLERDAAKEVLSPLAREDAYAAVLLARMARDAEDPAEAVRILDAIEMPPVEGAAATLVREQRAALASTQPTTSPGTQPTTRPAAGRWSAATREVLQDFDDRVLSFHESPAEYVRAEIAMVDRSLAPGEPWRADFTITNIGPFPVTLGPDGMINPVFLLSLDIEGDRQRSYPALMTVSVDRKRVLRPGESVKTHQTLDVGPPRRASRYTPQHLQRIKLTAILDAERDAEGAWKPSAYGQKLRPVYFNRLPATTTSAAMEALTGALSGDSELSRMHAIEVVGQLFGEQQRAQFGQLTYTPGEVSVKRLHTILGQLLGSGAWEVRVRALEALQVAGLDRSLLDRVETCLGHPHWLVRLMALRVVARQGARVSDQAERMAEDDAHELVRAMAESYLTRWNAGGAESE